MIFQTIVAQSGSSATVVSSKGVGTMLVKNLYLDGSFEGFLNIESFAHDGLVELPLKRQQVHVRLRLGNKLSDLTKPQRKSRSSTAF